MPKKDWKRGRKVAVYFRGKLIESLSDTLNAKARVEAEKEAEREAKEQEKKARVAAQLPVLLRQWGEFQFREFGDPVPALFIRLRQSVAPAFPIEPVPFHDPFVVPRPEQGIYGYTSGKRALQTDGAG